MKENAKRGIILMNLGSPSSTEVKDVKKYLMEFLMDKRVIDYPYIFRAILVGGIIVPFRASRSANAYKSIWTKEGSPLINISRQQRELLQDQVGEPIELAMRYGKPTMQEAFDKLLKREPGLEEVLAIPLYPQYAMSSYETAVEYAREVYAKNKYPFTLNFVKPFFDEQQYLQALQESIRPYLNQDYDHILFSFHGIPQRHITKADTTGSHCLKVDNCCDVDSVAHKTCYRHQCFFTAKQMVQALGIPEGKYSFAFQSRLGQEQWLKPYTAVRLTEMPKEGIKKLLIVCPAFVSDCLETLEEIAEEGKHSFLESGGTDFTLIPCLNIQPLWIETLKTYVEGFRQGENKMILE